jgi:hypothetical protein
MSFPKLGKFSAIFFQIYFLHPVISPLLWDCDDLNVRPFATIPQVLGAFIFSLCFLCDIHTGPFLSTCLPAHQLSLRPSQPFVGSSCGSLNFRYYVSFPKLLFTSSLWLLFLSVAFCFVLISRVLVLPSQSKPCLA